MVSLEAQHIVTVLLPLEWGHLLATHPKESWLLSSCKVSQKDSELGMITLLILSSQLKTNMESVLSYTAVVEDCIHKELTLSRMAGPFLQGSIQGVK